jgi:dinuclear metal center YbgI/SA1388 family protein
MTVHQLIKYLESWAPKGASWEHDNVGLQIGSEDTIIKNVFLSLELNENSLNEAIKKNCNFIFTHHPLLFKPLSKIDFKNNPKAKLIETIIKKNITVYSAHTNLDFTNHGVSFQLAKRLKLINIKFLKQENGNQVKLAVFVPADSVDKVSEAIFNAGGGVIGEYAQCSFRNAGIGTFKGSELAHPAIGQKEVFEKVDEIKLEVLVNNWNLRKVINDMVNAHPYEEPAFDIIPLKNDNVNFGFGAIGNLEKSMTSDEFLLHVCSSLNTKNVRFNKGKNSKIKNVAVCGGSGAKLLYDAQAQNADAFVTADIKYHDFQEAENKILFVDAGHYETEIIVLDEVKNRIEKLFSEKKNKTKVFKYSRSTNPVRFFNNTGDK